MKIWYGMILVATVILTGYLVIVMNRYLPVLNASLSGIKDLQTKLEEQNKLITALQITIKKLTPEPNATASKPAQKDVGTLAIESLQDSLVKLKDADAKIKQADVNSAIDIVKTVKQMIWKASDGLTAHQKELRALMGPLDNIMVKWKQGEKATDTSQIAIGIRTILKKIDSKEG